MGGLAKSRPLCCSAALVSPPVGGARGRRLVVVVGSGCGLEELGELLEELLRG